MYVSYYDETIFDDDTAYINMLLSTEKIIMYKPILNKKVPDCKTNEPVELGKYYIKHNLLPGDDAVYLNSIETLRKQLKERHQNKDENLLENSQTEIEEP